MKLCNLLSGVSLGVLAFAAFETPARAQEQLPAIDVGAARPVAGGPGEGQGTNPGIEAAGSGSDTGGYGGAGPAQDPYNKSYVLENSSVGTRTDTPVMETPLNVQVVSQQVLQDQQVTSLDQALKNVSGVTITQQAGNNGELSDAVTIRGFTTADIYRDGFRVDGAASTITGLQFANVASVEVLKGSGAILYGFSEPGGIVSYTTKQPLDAPYYAVDQQIGSFGNYRTTIDATGPLNADKSLLYRMNMSYQNNGAPWGGPIDFTHDQNIFLAPVLKWNIDGANWVKLEADYQYDRSSYFYPTDPMVNGAWVTIPRNWNYDGPSPALTKSLYTALSWSHQFDNDWAIKQQIAYYRRDLDANPIFSSLVNGGPPLNFSAPTLLGDFIQQYTNSQATYSTNVDVTGHIDTFGAQHTLLLGGDFYKANSHTLEVAQGTLASGLLIAPVHLSTTFFPGGPLLPQSEASVPQDTGGLYAQDQIKLPYDFFFLAGARYQYIRQNGGGFGSPTLSTPGGVTANTAVTEQALTPRFGLLWRPEEWVSFYAHYAEGFSANSGTIYPATTVPPTSSSDTEAGVKFELLDKKLRAGVTYYDLTKTNYAVPDPNPAHACNGGPPGLSCSLVVGAVRSKGVEFDVQGTLLPGWNVTLAYTNMDALITKTNPGPDQTGTLGQRIPGVPRNLGSFTTSYEFQNDSPLKGLKIGGGVDYHGSQPYSAQPNVQQTGGPQYPLLSAYATVNLFTAYSFNIAGTKMTAQVNVNNLLDHTYYTDAATIVLPNTPGLAFGLRSYGAPFSVLGSLKAEWPGVPSPSASSSSIFAPSPSSARPYSWTGLYVGGQIGYGFGDNTGNVAFTTPGGMAGTPPLVGDASGVIGGAHLGYNLQIDPWVIGVEGTIDGANLSKLPLIAFTGPAYPLPGYNPVTYSPYGGVVGGSVASDIQGAIRARAGYSFGRLLPFVAGGAAFGRFSTTSFIGGIDFLPGGLYFASDNRTTTRVGWTLGGGVEYAVNDHWSARLEYRYSDFGHLTDVVSTSLFPGLTLSTSRELAQQQVQVGFSYKFGEDSSLDAAGFKALAPQNSLQSQTASQPLGPLGLPGSAPATTTAAAKPIASPVKPASPPTDWSKYTWTGVYLGFQAGYAWGNNSLNVVGFDTSTGSPFNANVTDAQAGWIGGAHLGYNYQIDRWVVGIEGMVDTTSFSRTTTLPVPFGGSVETAQTKSDVQATIRGRVGFAWDRALIYGAAGLAWERFDTSYGLYGNNSGNAGINGGNYFLGSNEIPNTRLGWTLGAGVEYALNDHWSVRGEYRYTNFGAFSNPGIDGGAFESTPGLMGSFLNANRQLALNQVELGFSYKFSAAPEPAPAARILKGPAVAFGSPPPVASPAINWTGFYVGGQTGYAYGANHGAYSYATPGGWVGSDPLIGDAKGVIVGGHLGYNRQFENWVVGVEGSVDGANLVKNSTLAVGNSNNSSNFVINGTYPANAVSTTVQSDIQGALRARAGYAFFDRLLTFASAGVALGDFSYQSNIAGYDNVGFFAAANPGQTVLRVGWTVGGGVEWAVNRNWSVRGEYRYADFGSLTDTPNQIFYPGSFYSGSRHLDQNQVQFGFNYKFGDAAPAPVIAKY